jgi:hypothetical protein
MPAVLNTGASVTLNASGNGTVYLGPTMPGVLWNVANVACFTSTAVSVPTFQLYSPSVSATNFIGGSYSGNQDSDNINIILYPGLQLIGVWTGGDSGAIATMSVYGTFTAPGNQ